MHAAIPMRQSNSRTLDGSAARNRHMSGSRRVRLVEVTSYKPGTPSWVDASSTDLAATVEFLTSLFGWNATDMGEEAGHYTLFDQGGKCVAAVGPKMPGDPGPAAWNTYITVVDADGTAAQVK